MPRSNRSDAMPFMTHRLLPAALALALLSGCASSFKAPDGPDSARIRVVSAQSGLFRGNTNTLMYPSGACQAPMSLGVVGGLDGKLSAPKLLGMPGAAELPPQTFIEREIPVGTRSLFSVRSLFASKTCTVSFSFVPEAAADYEAKVGWNATSCVVALRKIAIAADGSVQGALVDSFKRETPCQKGFW